jgi:hypothetical protein
MPQSRELQQPRESSILARDVFAFQEEREPIFKIQRDDIGLSPLFVESFRHRREF